MSVEKIAQAVIDLEDEEALDLVQKAIDQGVDPLHILQDGVMAGLTGIGELFANNEYFLGELVMGGNLVEECLAILEPLIPKAKGPKRGKVVIGAVQGDLHSIGYGLVAKQLELAGYEVHDVGIDVPSMKFIDKAREVGADIIGLSAFLVTTISYCKEILDYLNDMGLRDEFKVILGGAETNQAVADSFGADGWAENAIEAVKLCDRLLDH
ncbi:MAG: cobalamin-dependent protein [Bacillota bacterium]